MNQITRDLESQAWNSARQAAFVQDVLAAFTGRPADLLQFEEVHQKLRLTNVHYLGLQDIPLDQIVGSVGRYQDFTRAFLPRRDNLKARWRQVQRLVTSGGGLPPIELYKVGQVYFVRDGNHRVSVARQQRAPTIQAHVWEYETQVPLDADTDLDDWLCKAAQTAFVERTRITALCPDVHIRLTQPDGYEELLCDIEAYQQVLSTIDERQVAFDEAVTLWCEMRYEPIVDIIRQRHILQEFPGRTESDLFLWLGRNQQELEARYEDRFRWEEAADDLAQRFGAQGWSLRQVYRVTGRLAAAVLKLASTGWRATRRSLRRRKAAPQPPAGEK
jgi:hypothetical protein